MSLVTIKELKRVIESSETMDEAAYKAKISRNSMYWYLRKYNLKVIKKLKVVSDK